MRTRKIGDRSPLRVPAVSAKKNCNLAPIDCILEIKRTLNDCQVGQAQTGRRQLSVAV